MLKLFVEQKPTASNGSYKSGFTYETESKSSSWWIAKNFPIGNGWYAEMITYGEPFTTPPIKIDYAGNTLEKAIQQIEWCDANIDWDVFFKTILDKPKCTPILI